MAVQTKEIEIGGTTYVIQQFTTEKGLVHFNKLVKLLAPSLAPLLGENTPTAAQAGSIPVPEDQVTGNTLALAVDKLVENMDKVDTVPFIKELLANVFYADNSQPIKFSSEFQGRYDVMFKLVFEVVKFNYESVFSGSVFNLGALQMKVR